MQAGGNWLAPSRFYVLSALHMVDGVFSSNSEPSTNEVITWSMYSRSSYTPRRRRRPAATIARLRCAMDTSGLHVNDVASSRIHSPRNDGGHTIVSSCGYSSLSTNMHVKPDLSTREIKIVLPPFDSCPVSTWFPARIDRFRRFLSYL